MENISQMSLSFHTSITYNNFLTQCTEFPINLRFRSLRKKYNEKILKAKSSSGDLSWIENQLSHGEHQLETDKKKEYSPHNVSILWALKNYFVCRQIHELSGGFDAPLDPLPGPWTH